MDAVFYLLDALNLFKNKPVQKAKEISSEIGKSLSDLIATLKLDSGGIILILLKDSY
jgi:hypothetical protein